MPEFFTEEVFGMARDGSVMGGKIGEHLDIEHVDPLTEIARSVRGDNRLEVMLDYYGIRYHLFLKHNKSVPCCEENTLLDLLEECLSDPENPYDVCRAAMAKCTDLFWTIVAKDSAGREGKNTKKQTFRERHQKKETVRIQLVTNENGELSQQQHNEPSLYPFREPIVNPCTSDVKVFQPEEIEVWENLQRAHVIKSRIAGEVVVAKSFLAENMLMELGIYMRLMKLPPHPNLLPLMGVVDAGDGRIDQLVLPFIKGKQLRYTLEASDEQKTTWKRQLSNVISVLHNAGIRWADGGTHNVLIEEGGENVIVYDFGIGYYEGCADFDAKVMEELKIFDLERLEELEKYIDDLDTE